MCKLEYLSHILCKSTTQIYAMCVSLYILNKIHLPHCFSDLANITRTYLILFHNPKKTVNLLKKKMTLLNRNKSKAQHGSRHDICQKFYATTVLAERILRKKSVNRDIRQFATKESKCFKVA